MAATAYLVYRTRGRVDGIGRRGAAGAVIAAGGLAGVLLGLRPGWLAVLVGAAIVPAFVVERLTLAYARLLDETRFDLLTALLSRREGLEQGRALIEQGYRHQFPVCAAVLDVDHFKSINDRHGHRSGDHVLAEIAARVQSSLRAGDFAFRLGGEEFAIFFSHATEEQGLEAAWRVLRGIRSRPIRIPDGEVRVTASIGIAQSRRRETVESLIERADQALYEAKRSGRDRARGHSRMLLTASLG